MRYNVDIDPRVALPDEMMGKFWHFPIYVQFEGEINEETAAKFRADMKNAENAAKRAKMEILPVGIDSFGGCMYSVLSMVDAINDCSIPVATMVEGKAMSAGAFLFSCGAEGHRYISPNATVMIHTVALGRRGKIDEVRANTLEGDRLNNKMLELMSTNCGKNKNYFFDLIKQNNMADWYLSADDCLEHNLANKVGLPELNVRVKLEYEFK